MIAAASMHWLPSGWVWGVPPEASLKGQRVYCADGESDANEVDGVMTFT